MPALHHRIPEGSAELGFGPRRRGAAGIWLLASAPRSRRRAARHRPAARGRSSSRRRDELAPKNAIPAGVAYPFGLGGEAESSRAFACAAAYSRRGRPPARQPAKTTSSSLDQRQHQRRQAASFCRRGRARPPDAAPRCRSLHFARQADSGSAATAPAMARAAAQHLDHSGSRPPDRRITAGAEASKAARPGESSTTTSADGAGQHRRRGGADECDVGAAHGQTHRTSARFMPSAACAAA